jgi:2-polyprenyl-6-methoxyphenol hydroxylase-like FAD-dependent oxidoreductase
MRIAIAGAGIAGLATAAALAARGHQVQLFERDVARGDAAGRPERAERGSGGWRRPGVPQLRHSHAFLGRLRGLLAEREPGLLEALRDAGARELRFAELARPWFGELAAAPGDDALALIACRRTTFEWVLRSYVEALPGVALRSGVRVTGLEPVAGAAPPLRIGALRILDEAGRPERVAADLVIDASGRRTRSARWLADAGASPFACERDPCGIFYASRFFRFRDDVEPIPIAGGVLAVDLGYLKVGLFPGDGRTFSLTLAASPDDAPLQALLHEPGFEAAARALPGAAPFVSREVAEPISRLHAMSDLESVRRFALRPDGEPAVVGFAAVGDALIHTNPLYGRGCTLAFVHAHALADALDAEPDDPRAFALALEQTIEREIVPWYESSRAQDRDAHDVAAQLARGGDPYRAQAPDGRVEPRAYMRSLVRDGLAPAMREDADLLRAFLRVFNLLEPPRDLMKDPTIFQRVLAFHAARGERAALEQGPERAALLERIAGV